jgi:hypothetical protein
MAVDQGKLTQGAAVGDRNVAHVGGYARYWGGPAGPSSAGTGGERSP